MGFSWLDRCRPAIAGWRIFIVAGANSGIGLPTARALAEAGAHVVLAVRDTAKGEAAAESISGNCEVRRLDLADLASERAFANAWQGDSDVLINNAGVMRTPKRRTADGFEPEIGTNHLGHFALTNLLLPHVTDRVVTVASGAHAAARSPWPTSTGSGVATDAGRITSNRSWPICCSHSTCTRAARAR